LHAKDRNAKVGAIAGTYNTSSQNRDWLSVLLADAAPDVDFIALHDSFAPLILGKYDYTDPGKREEAYMAMFAQPYSAGEDIHEVQKKCMAVQNPPPTIAITEHFPLFGGGGGRDQMLAILDQSRTLAAALYTASLFHTYMRNHVTMATYNLAVSKWFGALVTDTDQGLIRTPTYHVFNLYRNHMVGELVFSQVNGPEYSTGGVGTVKARSAVPYLDAVASLDPSSNLELAVINRSLSKPLNARIQVEGASGTAEVTTLAGPSADAVNGPALSATVKSGSADQVGPRTSSWSAGAKGEYTFPPASLTIFKWPGAMSRSRLERISPPDRERDKTEEL
jgi:alpha-N-arabinofuranosidase